MAHYEPPHQDLLLFANSVIFVSGTSGKQFLSFDFFIQSKQEVTKVVGIAEVDQQNKVEFSVLFASKITKLQH